jgi:hypothetical protein
MVESAIEETCEASYRLITGYHLISTNDVFFDESSYY